MASIAALPVLIGLVAGLRDLNPRPLLRELVALRAVRPPGADA